jgi:uncharacterized membrane protein
MHTTSSALAIALSSGGAIAQVEFHILNPLTNFSESRAEQVSADGAFAIGTSRQGSLDAATRWDTDGSSTLGLISPALAASRGLALSADGSVAVGGMTGPGPIGQERAFAWHDGAGGPTLTTLASTLLNADAMDVSPDGSVALLVHRSTQDTYRWNTLTNTGTQLPGTILSIILGDAMAGSTNKVCGNAPGVFAGHAFIWNDPGPEQLLCPLTGSCGLGYGSGTYDHPLAFGMSDDGVYTVGCIEFSGMGYGTYDTLPYRYSTQDGVEMLHTGTSDFGIAYDASADGSVVVGTVRIGDDFQRAFVWTPSTGTRLLRDILSDANVDTDGWQLDEAVAVSDDGTVIVGNASIVDFAVRGFVVRLGTPGNVCDSIDFNNDGLFPDTADIDDFLSVFSGGPCSTDPTPGCNDIDFNNDGLFPDTLDIDSLLSVFSGGPCI